MPPGGTIAVLSPSGSHAVAFARRLRRGLDFLTSAGYQVRVLQSARRSDPLGSAGSPQSRADDLHAAFSDPEVALVLTTIGGHTANTVLEHLDFDLLATHPTWLCGYSDVTALLLAVRFQSGVQTVMGPQVLPQLGDFGGCDAYTWRSLINLVAAGGAGYRPSGRIITEVLDWDRDDDRVRVSAAAPLATTLRPGTASGPALPANLDVLMRLAGTPYWPSFSDAVLFLEQGEDTNPGLLESLLVQLRLTGALDEVTGIGLGRFPAGTGLNDIEQVRAVVARAVPDFDGPIVAGLEIGHVDPQCSIACGASALLEAGRDRARLSGAAVG